MRFKFTVFLLALNVVTFGLIVYLASRDSGADAASSGLSARIGREIIEADRIELSGKGLDSPRVLRRNGSDWNITEPLEWAANYFAVNRILNQLQFLEEEASFPVDELRRSGQSLADYGLENPALSLKIAEDGQAIELSIGTFTDIGNNVYLLGPEKKRIYVVSREVIDSLLVDLADLRTREIFSIPVFEVEALGVQLRGSSNGGNGELKVRLAKTGKGWIFESPVNAEADPTLVANTINQLSSAKVIEFPPDASDPNLQGLESPSMRVTLFGNKRRQTLLIGNRTPTTNGKPAYFAKLEDNPTVFTVAAAPFDELAKAQEALRERNFLKFDPDALTAINISEEDREIRLQRLESGNEWQVIQSTESEAIQPYRADPAIMTELIEDLRSLRASGFVVDSPTESDLARLGFNDPRRSVSFRLDGEAALELTLAHPRDENEKLYAKSSDAAFIYEVERRPTLRLLPLNALDYRNRILEKLPEAARVQSVAVTDSETGETLLERALEGDRGWVDTLSEYPETEAAAVLALVDAIRQTEVDAYLYTGFTPEAYRVDDERTLPWRYRLTAEIVLPGDETDRIETREIVLTERLSGTVQVGGSERHNAVFEISRRMLDALYVLTGDLEPPPEAGDEPVPDPEPVEPVPAPEPIPNPESGDGA